MIVPRKKPVSAILAALSALVLLFSLCGCGSNKATYDPAAQVITTASGFKVKLTKKGSGYTAAIVGATSKARTKATQASMTPEEASVLAQASGNQLTPVSYGATRQLAYDWQDDDIVIAPYVPVDVDDNTATPDENVPVTDVTGNESDYQDGQDGDVGLDLSEVPTDTPEITVKVPKAYVRDHNNIVWHQQDDGALALSSLPTTTTAINPKITEGLGDSMPGKLFGQETTASAEFIKSLADRYAKAVAAATTNAQCSSIAQEIAALQKWLGASDGAKAVVAALTKATGDVTAKNTAITTAAQQAAEQSASSGSGSSSSSGGSSSKGGSSRNKGGSSGGGSSSSGSSGSSSSHYSDAMAAVNSVNQQQRQLDGVNVGANDISGLKSLRSRFNALISTAKSYESQYSDVPEAVTQFNNVIFNCQQAVDNITTQLKSLGSS